MSTTPIPVERPIVRIAVHILLIAGAVIFAFPFYWVATSSVKPLSEVMSLPVTWWPSEWQWENFWNALTFQDKGSPYTRNWDAFWAAITFRGTGEGTAAGQFLSAWSYCYHSFFVTCLRNTLWVALWGVAGTVVSNAIVAYGFSRLEWKGRDTLFFLTMATMMVPFPVIMIPLFTTFAKLGWIGTLYPLWVPYWFGSAFNIFLLRQFFRTIPTDLSDAARIDGCNEFGIFLRVIVPLARPALAVVALFHFLYAWNDFLGPLLYLTDQKTYTLSLALFFYQSQKGGTEWNLMMAACTMVILPVILVFFAAQRSLISGISLTGLKG